MQVEGRQAAISFGRGLFVLRYASAEDVRLCPVVRFELAGGSSAGVQLVTRPGAMPGRLRNVGELVVIAAERAGALDIRIEPSQAGGSLGCSLSLDRLGPEDDLRGAADTGVEPLRASAGSDELRVSAHLARAGDLFVAPGEWIAGPEAPLPIEGLSLPAYFADGARVDCQVLTVGAAAWSDWAGPGMLAGSRGQSRPLRGVRFRLATSGPWSLHAEALFLGMPPESKTGALIEFVSPMPFDALVGLRIDVVRQTDRVAPFVVTNEQPVASGRLKVFRSSRIS